LGHNYIKDRDVAENYIMEIALGDDLLFVLLPANILYDCCMQSMIFQFFAFGFRAAWQKILKL